MRASLLLLLLASCAKPVEPPVAGPTKTFVDSRGKSVTIAWPPKHIVSTDCRICLVLGSRLAGD